MTTLQIIGADLSYLLKVHDRYSESRIMQSFNASCRNFEAYIYPQFLFAPVTPPLLYAAAIIKVYADLEADKYKRCDFLGAHWALLSQFEIGSEQP